jgi:hypothetical protein
VTYSANQSAIVQCLWSRDRHQRICGSAMEARKTGGNSKTLPSIAYTDTREQRTVVISNKRGSNEVTTTDYF